MSSLGRLSQAGGFKQKRLKGLYVGFFRAARLGLSMLGLYQAMRRSQHIGVRHLASLFAIYDIAEMEKLDVAWWCYDATAVAEEFLAARPGARVLEWGSGASTLWLAKRAREVISIEDDANWYGQIHALVPTNVTHRLVPSDTRFRPFFAAQRRDLLHRSYREYVLAGCGQGRFDLIVVDGRCRRRCLHLAARLLKSDGLILLDNIEFDRYATIAPVARMVRTTVSGRTPCLPFATAAALFRHPGVRTAEGSWSTGAVG